MLKLKHDEQLSNFAFRFNLRRYNSDWINHALTDLVGRCRLALSNPR